MFRSSRSPALRDTGVASSGMSGAYIHLSRAAVSDDVVSSSESFHARMVDRPISTASGQGEGISKTELCASKFGHHQFSLKTEFKSARPSSRILERSTVRSDRSV